jgi:predicted RNA-binding protein with PUA-like domain
MKDMNVGDLAFFYASGEGKGKKPGIVGIMEVVSEAEPDLTAFEEGHHGHVKNPKMRGTEAKPRWFMVHVEFRKKLSAPVTRAELQKYTTGDGVLAKMQEFNTARLSVSKVSEDEWDFIVNNLVDGYADEDEGEAAGVMKSNGDVAMADGEDFMDDNLVNGTSAPPEIKETIESEPPTTDSLLAADTAATSSRPPSRGGSKKPASLAGSLAPPAGSRAGSRARSRTPVSRRGSVQPQAPAGEAMGTIEE